MSSVIKFTNKKRQKTKRSASERIDEYWDVKSVVYKWVNVLIC